MRSVLTSARRYSALIAVLGMVLVLPWPAAEKTPAAQEDGIWIGKTELNALPMSGVDWSDLKATADAAWVPQRIEEQVSQGFHIKAMAGALVYARLAPDPRAIVYRIKVANAIRDVMAFADNLQSSATAPVRNLGAWAIAADLIDLAAYDPPLDKRFRAWLTHKLDVGYRSNPATIREQIARPNNQGSWATFSLTAASLYLGDTAALEVIANRMRRFLGDTSAPYTFGWDENQTWQMNPRDPSTWVGINPKGAVRDGHRFDGIQPEDQRRGSPETYDPSRFPNDFSDVRYNEVSLGPLIGATLMLHRAGYTDLVDASDRALLRAAQWIKYAADTFPSKGYVYFTGGHEAVRPLIRYLYPDSNLPTARARSQLRGAVFGYGWTHWTHEGRSLR